VALLKKRFIKFSLLLSTLFLSHTLSAQTWQNLGTNPVSPVAASFTSISLLNNNPYIVYQDNESNGQLNGQAFGKMFNGTEWVAMGVGPISQGSAYDISTASNGSTPYIIYQDASNGYRATVKKFENNQWTTVGSVGFSDASMDYTSIAMYGNTPYVVYRDGARSSKATVKKFNGSNWETVGNAGFSLGSVQYNSIALNGTQPYVAYHDVANGGKITVMKFNGSNWQTVGTAGFSTGPAYHPTIALRDTIPYVVYSDRGLNAKATVKRFVGNNWVDVGMANFSAGEANYTSIKFVDTIPYVCYQDYGNDGKATVKKFTGGNWVTVGSDGFSTGLAYSPSIAIAPDKLYVTYRDSRNGFSAIVKHFTLPNTLPVNFVDFVGLARRSENILTGTIINDSHQNKFEIERKGDIGNFGSIGFMPQVNELGLNKFNFIDRKPLNGNNYYRIKYVDNNGESHYNSTVVYLKNDFSISNLVVHPNPSMRNITIIGLIGDYPIKLTDNSGKIIKTVVATSNTATIDISQLPKGIYYLSNGIQYGKVVKE
jgi:hypothetical protein